MNDPPQQQLCVKPWVKVMMAPVALGYSAATRSPEDGADQRPYGLCVCSTEINMCR